MYVYDSAMCEPIRFLVCQNRPRKILDWISCQFTQMICASDRIVHNSVQLAHTHKHPSIYISTTIMVSSQSPNFILFFEIEIYAYIGFLILVW